MAIPSRDTAVAYELRAEVKAAAGKRRTWRKVTTVLDLFGVYRLTEPVRRRIDGSLAEVGLRSEPPFAIAERSDSVRLFLLEEEGQGGGSSRSPVKDISSPDFLPRPPQSPGTSGVDLPGPGALVLSNVDVSRWPRGSGPKRLMPDPSVGELDPLWADVDGVAAPQDAYAELAQFCPGLTLEMVENLLNVDDQPGVHLLADIEGGRRISAFSAMAVETDLGAADGGFESDIAGIMVFQMVEFLAGTNWIVSCWHDPIGYRGAHVREIAAGDPLIDTRLATRTAVKAAIAPDWIAGPHENAGDLGGLILRELARTYAPARRELHAWLETWELAFYQREETVDKGTLVELRSLVAEFRRRLAELNQPGVPDEKAWFTGAGTPDVPKRTDAYIDRALSDLRQLQESIRSGFDLVSSREATKQIQLAQDQQARTKNLQSTLEIGAAVLLVPTLIAGIYGANTAVPGGGTWGGFGGMLIVMILCTALALIVISRLRGNDVAEKEERDE